MASAPDMELKKAFTELQMKMVDAKQKIKFTDMQSDNFKRQIAHAQLTDQEIGGLPEGTKVYESVGRMFLLSDIKAVREGLDSKQKTCKSKIKSLEVNKSHLENSVKESENNLRELITLKRTVT
jgi:prefoldin subunit 1